MKEWNSSIYENLNRISFIGDGQYDIPVIRPQDIAVNNFIGFNYAKTCKTPSDTGVHFFIDDYQFARLWNNPVQYLSLISKFYCVCTPDFSTYTDYPKVVQIYNHYRKHWLGAYWQAHGINVIPTISWSDKSSYEWCFDGEPIGGTVAVSSVGTQKSEESKRLFIDGYNEMIKRLQPEKVIFYGSVPDECKGNIARIRAFQEKFKEAKIYGW